MGKRKNKTVAAEAVKAAALEPVADPESIEEAIRNLLDRPLSEALKAAGIPLDKAEEWIRATSARFPGGVIPQELLVRWLRSEVFSSARMLAFVDQTVTALGQRFSTGRGPIRHSDANVA